MSLETTVHTVMGAAGATDIFIYTGFSTRPKLVNTHYKLTAPSAFIMNRQEERTSKQCCVK